MLDYFDDIATDLRILAHVADWRALSGPEFFVLAFRMAAYQGVLRARFRAEWEADQRKAKDAAAGIEAAQAVAEAEVDGWIERG